MRAATALFSLFSSGGAPIWHADERPAEDSVGPVLATGFAELDRELPGGGAAEGGERDRAGPHGALHTETPQDRLGAVVAGPHSDFLALCFDENRVPVFVPNLLYPARLPIGIAAHNEAVCICPPPPAVGESRPWDYGDDPEWTRTMAFRECCRATLWGLPWSRLVDAATIDLLATAATVIFLRESALPGWHRAFTLRDNLIKITGSAARH